MLVYNYFKNLKNKKTKKLEHIKSENKYLYFCEYNDLTSHQIIDLKLSLKNKNIGFYFIKNKLLHSNYNLKGKGSLFVLYFEKFEDFYQINKILSKIQKITPLSICYNNTLYSIYKLKQLKQSSILPYILKNQLTLFKQKLVQIQI